MDRFGNIEHTYLRRQKLHEIHEIDYEPIEVREIIQETVNKIFKNRKIYAGFFKPYFNTDSINKILNSYENEKKEYIYLEIDRIDINKIYENFDKWILIHVFENEISFDNFIHKINHRKSKNELEKSIIFKMYFDRDMELVSLYFYKPVWDDFEIFKKKLESKGFNFKTKRWY